VPNHLRHVESHHVGISPREDRGGAAEKVGEVEAGEEEGGRLRVNSMLGLIGVVLGLFPPEYPCVYANGFDAK
jgi:hypothetical protein